MIQEVLRTKSRKVHDPAGREVLILEDAVALETAFKFGLATHDVYREALRIGICPYRYLRNRESISEEEQLRLCTSCVAVVGAGGLGGHVILLLARLGIGHLVVVDSDHFDETNLNRQTLSSQESMGRWKAEEAVRVVGGINPGVRVTAHRVRIDPFNSEEVLSGADVIVDALDNIPDRFTVENASRSLGIPMVHGALAGFEGQVMTIFPEDPGLELIYGRQETSEEDPGSDRSQNPEAILGVPAPTPALIATLQAMEVVKILLRRGKLFRNVMVYVDLETGEMRPFEFETKIKSEPQMNTD